jgi:hypothetical protein
MHLPSNKQQNLANIGVIKVYFDVGFLAFANAGEHSPRHTLQCVPRHAHASMMLVGVHALHVCQGVQTLE